MSPNITNIIHAELTGIDRGASVPSRGTEADGEATAPLESVTTTWYVPAAKPVMVAVVAPLLQR